MRKALILILSYLGWNSAFRLMLLSLSVYFMARSGSPFPEISETTNKNQILVVGIGCLSFIYFLTQMNPIATVSRSEVITSNQIEMLFYPGFLRGAVFACLFAFVALSAGYYKYIGFFIQNDTPGLAVPGLIFRALSILLMVYIDEFIFRGRFMNLLRDQSHPLRVILLSALFYSLSKQMLFHLGFAHILTLGLLGTALGLRSYLHRGFTEGAGIVAGFLIVAHCGFSLPIFGNEAQGILLLQYDIQRDLESTTIRLLTGGLGGPLSSMTIQALLLFDILWNYFREKKSLWPLRPAEIR